MNNRILSLAVALLIVTAGAAVADPTLHWDRAETPLGLGDQTTLSVMLDESLDVRTLEIYIRFDPDVVTSIDGEPGALFDGFNNFWDFEAYGPDTWHGYCVIMGADDWATGPGELFSWTVEGATIGISPVEAVELTLLPPGGGDYPDADLTPAEIHVGNITDAPATAVPESPRLMLYPNPFNPRTRVELSLPGGGRGRLEILDLQGRVVDRPWSGVLGPQALFVDWDGRDLGGRALPSGVYTFRLRGDRGRTAMTRGVLLR